MYGNQLAHTGTGIITIGGFALGGWHLLALTVAVVLLGALITRIAFRRGREVGDT
ncbi:hypothetical protein ACIBCM_07855 [Streptomyces sp. NPDC051018]|uniref:hypothetical protein n=1 Tax=Streptomyces sp. NPDC051018 TaxID=3365639 RepID=UPI0037B2FFFF